MLSKLLLNSNNSLPFQPAQLIFHNPTLNQISMLGEKAFWEGCQYLTFSKNALSYEDKSRLADKSDFDILMIMMKTDKIATALKEKILNMFLLCLPQYKVNFLPSSIMLFKQTEEGKIESHLIDNSNFEEFKKFISRIFCLNFFKQSKQSYNPGGPQAAALVQKFRKRQETLNKLKHKDSTQVAILDSYVSILSVGLQKSKRELMQYTVYQIIDEFNRFMAKFQYDMYVQQRLAGAENLDQVKNWMGDLPDTL